MIEELGFKSVVSLETDQAISIGSFKITTRRALDSDIDSIFQIQVENLNILNVVDSWIDPETLDLLSDQKPWDLILWPFQTMLESDVIAPLMSPPPQTSVPTEWIEQLRRLNPRAIIASACQFTHEPDAWTNHSLFPISYATFIREVQTALPRALVRRLDPGVTLTLNSTAIESDGQLSWVKPIGDQNVDYEFRGFDHRPTASAFAQLASKLSVEQMQEVRSYCTSTLTQRYRDVGGSNDDYFRRSRRWRLKVYDSKGDAQVFNFCVRENEIEVDDSETAGGADNVWITEIAASKLYSAIYQGEALTSLMIRVNDATPHHALARALREADVFEDPLIRCLYNEDVVNYQRLQLESLKNSGELLIDESRIETSRQSHLDLSREFFE